MSTELLEQVSRSTLVTLSVDQFHRMIEAGILEEGEPVELIDGVLVRRDRRAAGETGMTHGTRHALAVALLQEMRTKLGNFGGHFRTQLPVTLSDKDEPEPDLAVVRGAPSDYAARHPGPNDLLLVVEVADSSLEQDRTTKQRMYARAGVVRNWLVNLVDDRIEVYEEASREEGRYRRKTELTAADQMRLELPGGVFLDVPVADLIPPRPPR